MELRLTMARLHLPFVESRPISQVLIYRLPTFDQNGRRSIGRIWTMSDMSWFN
jgi:hypothetical protein